MLYISLESQKGVLSTGFWRCPVQTIRLLRKQQKTSSRGTKSVDKMAATMSSSQYIAGTSDQTGEQHDIKPLEQDTRGTLQKQPLLSATPPERHPRNRNTSGTPPEEPSEQPTNHTNKTKTRHYRNHRSDNTPLPLSVQGQALNNRSDDLFFVLFFGFLMERDETSSSVLAWLCKPSKPQECVGWTDVRTSDPPHLHH